MGSSNKKKKAGAKKKPPVIVEPDSSTVASEVASVDDSTSENPAMENSGRAERGTSKLLLQLTIFLFAIWLAVLAYLAYRVNFVG